ncbi:hypothetical protein [Polaribacter sp. Asnod1-A03]|uniref:hypothetical protein n=1 Tax=Polaribacter sp. Asnod1-A03 TaxID=3160581 RepID=UPI00386AB6E8
MKLYYSLFFLLFLISCSTEESSTSDDEVEEERGRFTDDWTFEFYMQSPSANSFKLWVPENTTVGAVLVLAPGGATNGTGLVRFKEWQDYAQKEKLALLGVHVNSDFTVASYNLIYALNKIASARNVNYISDLPFLMRGFSHGGRFGYNFASLFNVRTIAFSNIRGTTIGTDKRLPPGLFITGGKDSAYRNEIIFDAFLSQRKENAIACFVEEPRAYHEVANSDNLTRAFFTSILKERLQNSKLIELKEDDYFLGDNTSFEYTKYIDYSGEKSKASSLIDENFIEIWLNSVK